jgi:hypothetical protein
MMLKTFVLLLLCFNASFAQRFIPLDEETHEFIEDVNYHLYLDRAEVSSGTCNNEQVTELPLIAFDSVAFTKIGYKASGLRKEAMTEVVLLTKSFLTLDEVVIVNAKKEYIVLGEKNRFIKRYSRPIVKGLDFGIVISNNSGKDLPIDKLLFYVEKVKYKTAYKIRFHMFKKIVRGTGREIADFSELRYVTDTLYLQPKQKNAIEVPLEKGELIMDGNPVFISFELLGYYDENNNAITPAREDLSRIKFEMSDVANYYARMADAGGIVTEYLININTMINYDFANAFFSTPSKSIIVTPAVLLYARKE